MGETGKGQVSAELNGITAKGLVPEGTTGDLTMPDGIPWCDSGTTGMRFPAMHSYTPEKVMKYITKKIADYPPYKEEIWDCEDHAFLAAADIRCNFPGAPVGIAIGKATHSSHATIRNQMHAVNYLWFQSGGEGEGKAGENWEHRIFDPAGREWVDDFDAKVIIPLPISGLKDHKELKPFADSNKYPFRIKAAFQLDKRAHQFVLPNGDVMKTLTSGDFEKLRCPGSAFPEYNTFFEKKGYWSLHDTVFYVFAQIRRKHMGATVGVAFGEIVFKDGTRQEQSALVLWSSPNQFILWDIDTKSDMSDLKKFGARFEPRIVIV
ncbi:MAG: hypothetical protein ACP5OU_09610 [Methanothrix sp.]